MARKVSKVLRSTSATGPKTLACGLIMPISAIGECSADHWAEVKAVITESVESILDPQFAVRLVSDADDSGVIQKRIVQNVYNSDIVVCDVSAKNPNVMFELGLRLAFDKATVIIKDDKTDYSFDTGIIEHIPYPRDLRFSKVVDFKKALADKVLATHKASVADPTHSPFLKNFGKFQVAALSQTEVPSDKIVVEMLSDLQTEVRSLKRRTDDSPTRLRFDGGSFEMLVRIQTAVAKYRRALKIKNPSILVGNEEFYRTIERDVDAPHFFSTRNEFVTAVDSVLRLP